MPGVHFHATGDPHHHHHDHDHDHNHDHDHDHDHEHGHDHHDHAHGFGDAAASLGGPSALFRFLMSNYIAIMAVVVLVALVLLLRRRRTRSRPDAGTDYGKEAQMNLAVRRARALEAMQAEYDAKAKQWEEVQAKKRELDAEERARRVAAAPLMGPVGGSGGSGGAGGGGAGGSGGSNVVEWSPLMGSGPVGGFKSNRCTRRGG